MSSASKSASNPAKRLAIYTTSMLSDVRSGEGVIAPGLTRFSGSGTTAGRAITARCEEGALQAVFRALEEARPGDFLCIQGPGDTAYLGDLLAANIANRGLAGAIVDGFVRDRSRIATMDLTIMARGLTPVNLRRQGSGSAQVALEIGGVTLNPGDWVVADDDGVIVVAPEEVDATLADAVRQTRVEARVRELILTGTRVPDAVRQAMSELE